MGDNANNGVKLSFNSQHIPIFFVQLGNHVNLFLDKILLQAQHSNGKENVYVLADKNLHLYRDFNCIDVSKYLHGREFDSLYQHHSSNKYSFEKACFDRWFIINDVVNDLNIDYFFHADCDVLITEDLNPTYAHLLQHNYDGSVMYFEHDGKTITSGHSSFWSKKLLGDFCNFVSEKYADGAAFNEILNVTRSGFFLGNKNVSDMIFLDIFRRSTILKTLNLFSLEDEGIGFDFNLNVSSNGWRKFFKINKIYGIKAITRANKSVYAEEVDNGTRFKFYTLHFQGYITKSLIPKYITYGSSIDNVQNTLLAYFTFTKRRLILKKNWLRDKLKIKK
ncbi:hypothetical protein ACFQZS_11450 [Mucilaginibacter calamicampi]|uniref:Nucleotide-diphospho-sugar transferase n=1 Tax=Mucilaginibacter calamicampi TaxID=1302352 RepID=A0ABW2YWA8_9SPHI